MVENVRELPQSGRYYIKPSQVFDGARLLSNKLVAVENNCVVSINSFADIPTDAQLVSQPGVLSPGFFDIQVNGGGNTQFNTDPSVEGLAKIAQAHRQFGTTLLLPTVITDAPGVMDTACDAVLACYGQNGIGGIHLEGPHISPNRKGTHKVEHIRPLDKATFSSIEKLREKDIPVVITLAPEAVSEGQITALVDMGVVVSIGHSDAKASDVALCLQQGVSLFTHLFNAMSQMHGREPGVVGAAISSEAYCSIICDGKHVADEMLGLACRARPAGAKMIIISDAMATVGGNDSFTLYGETITLKNGELINEEGNLAGAHTTMAASIAYLIQNLSMDLQTCLQMAITHPAALLGLEKKVSLLGSSLSNCIIIPENVALAQTLN